MMSPWLLSVVLLAYGASAFGWRSYRQWRRTGSTGFRGISGKPGSPEWLGGVLLALAFALALALPPLALTNVLTSWPLPPSIRVAGWIFLALGFLGTIAAQLTMGDAWRIGVDEQEETELVSHGAFAICRNPIFTSMLSFLLGVFLILPHLASLLALVAALIGLQIQVRLVEEPYLTRTLGARYQRYAGRVGRFLPGIGRFASDG